MTASMFGPYRLEELLGKGGMGEVYRAFDTEHERFVALKVLSPELSTNPAFRQRFQREARATSILTDPHVIPIHRFGEIAGKLYLDMRLIDGVDLGCLLRTDGSLTPERAVRVIEQIAEALDSAHAAGIIHRDVKASNVLMTRSVSPGGPQSAYLVDFGIARVLDSSSIHTMTGALIGTLAYMAPEQFLGGELDGRTDVYALTCLLYEALTAARPFHGEGLAAMMHAHLNREPPRPSAHHSSLAPFDEVVAHGMAKRAADRPHSAGALAVAARAALTSSRPHRSVAATRPSDLPDPVSSPGAGPVPARVAEPTITGQAPDRASATMVSSRPSAGTLRIADGLAALATGFMTVSWVLVAVEFDPDVTSALVPASFIGASAIISGLLRLAANPPRSIISVWIFALMAAFLASFTSLTVNYNLDAAGWPAILILVDSTAAAIFAFVIVLRLSRPKLNPKIARRLQGGADIASAAVLLLLMLVSWLTEGALNPVVYSSVERIGADFLIVTGTTLLGIGLARMQKLAGRAGEERVTASMLGILAPAAALDGVAILTGRYVTYSNESWSYQIHQVLGGGQAVLVALYIALVVLATLRRILTR